MKLVLDVDVLLDALLGRQPFAQDIAKLFVAGYYGDVSLWASAHSLASVLYLLRKANGAEGAQTRMGALLGELSVCSVDGDDLRAALDPNRPDADCAIVHQAALKLKADFIVSRKTQDFGATAVPVLSPAEVITYLRKERHLDYAAVEF